MYIDLNIPFDKSIHCDTLSGSFTADYVQLLAHSLSAGYDGITLNYSKNEKKRLYTRNIQLS